MQIKYFSLDKETDYFWRLGNYDCFPSYACTILNNIKHPLVLMLTEIMAKVAINMLNV